MEASIFRRFIVALITDQLLHFYSSVPFLYLNSLSAHSRFPPSLPLISLTALFGHPSQQLSKKQLWSIFSAAASAGDWWQQLGKGMEKARSVKYIKLLSWDQLGYYLELFCAEVSDRSLSWPLAAATQRGLRLIWKMQLLWLGRLKKARRVQTAQR